jgi:beta-galactosidase/beta-glucuronidase
VQKKRILRLCSHEVALELKSRLLDQSVLKTSQDLDMHLNLDTEQKKSNTFCNHWFCLLKLGITSNYGKTIGLIIILEALFMKILENSVRVIPCIKTK